MLLRASSAWVTANVVPQASSLVCVRSDSTLAENIAYGGRDIGQTPPGMVTINAVNPTWSLNASFESIMPDPNASIAYPGKNYGGGARADHWLLKVPLLSTGPSSLGSLVSYLLFTTEFVLDAGDYINAFLAAGFTPYTPTVNGRVPPVPTT